MTSDVDVDSVDVLTDMTDTEYEAYVADFLSPRPIEWAGIVIFAVIMVVGVAGNALVIAVVASAKRMRTSMNVLLMNLAVADLVILLVCLPTTVANDVTHTFWFPEYVCKGVLFVQNTGVYVAVLSLTYVSYERWRAVTSPLDSISGSRLTIVAAIWFCAMILALPEPITVQLAPASFDRPNFTSTWGTQCFESWSPEVEKTYQLIQTSVFYVLPLMIILGLCTSTIRTLNSPEYKNLGRRQIGSRKRAIRMLAVVVLCFALSYLPVHAHNISVAFHKLEEVAEASGGGSGGDEEVDLNLSALRKLLARFFSYSSSCLNPILYNILSRKFRKEYKRVVLCSRCRRFGSTGTLTTGLGAGVLLAPGPGNHHATAARTPSAPLKRRPVFC